MNILTVMVGHRPPKNGPTISGEIKNTCTLNTLLERSGHNVHIVSGPSIWDKEQGFSADPKVTYTPKGIGRGVLYYFTRAMRMYSAIKKIVCERNIDVVHCHSPVQVLISKIAIRISLDARDIPIVVTAHGSYLPELRADLNKKTTLYQFFRVINSRIQRIIDVNSFRFADKIIVTSEFQKREMFVDYNVPNDKIVRIYNPSAQYFERKTYESRNGNYILFVGRFARKKGLEFLISLFAELSDTYEGTLRIVGGGMIDKGLMEKVKADIKTFRLENRVFFLKEISEKALAKMYRDCDVLLVPSEGYESIPTVAIEGVKAGAHVLATNNWGIPEVIHRSENLAAEKDMSDWLVKLKAIIQRKDNDCVLRGGLSSEFNNEKITKSYIDLFKDSRGSL